MSARRVVFAVPGDPDTPTGGYGYDRRVADELRAAGWAVVPLRLPEGFPFPDEAALAAAYDALAAQPERVPLLVDGLALGAMPAVGDAIGPMRPLVALVHHPLALESGLDPVRAAALRASERAALAAARGVVTTSRSTAGQLVADYGVPASRITVAPPGTDPVDALGADRAHDDDRCEDDARGGDVVRERIDRRDEANRPLRLLSVGTLVPRKGHDRLLDALAALRDRSWRLTIVGDATRDPATARALREQAHALGLADRVRFAGAVAPGELAAHYASADLFVLASRHEGFGMAYAEALAHGLPTVGTTAGAIAEAAPPDAARLVPPDDPDALRDALARLIDDADARRRLARAARRAAAGFVRWPQTAARVADALERAGAIR
jgi:glycosyltransferase involved in cell wall biosynthesis